MEYVNAGMKIRMRNITARNNGSNNTGVNRSVKAVKGITFIYATSISV
jgi:hypothetical protein